MKRSQLIVLTVAVLTALTSCGSRERTDDVDYSTSWRPDTLGHGFEMRYVHQPDDYSGAVRSTIIRRQSPCTHGKGVLYVHGFNDYFFQREMADLFVDSCYSFYAVDLRKYGRSVMEGQKMFQVRDISEYYADIDSALAQMRRDSIDRVVLMGHSTGGLITSAYMNASPDTIVKALILNSPFLDWNLGSFTEKVLVPAVSVAGRLFPNLKISQSPSHVYSSSLLRKDGGEWDYDTAWKLEESPDVDAGWIRAIERGQEQLHSHSDIRVPMLLLHSDSSYVDGDPLGKSRRADAVLDVADISRYGRLLGADVTEVTVEGGLHDLALSRRAVRTAMFRRIFSWLDQQNL